MKSQIVKDSVWFGDVGTWEETPDYRFGWKETLKRGDSSEIESDPDEELL